MGVDPSSGSMIRVDPTAKLGFRIYDPSGSEGKIRPRIYDLSGSHGKIKAWIHDPCGSHKKMDKIGVKMHNYLRKALLTLVMVHSDALFN